MGRKKPAGPKRTRTKRPTLTETQAARGRDPRQPLWEPEGLALAAVPAEVQQMMHQILRPFYERFVTNAADALEQSLAMTLVHLMWLEVLEQFDTKRLYTRLEAPFHLPGNYAAKIDQQLRVLDGKVKVGYLLAHLRQCIQHGSGETLMPLHATSPATCALPAAEEELPKLLTFEANATATDAHRRPAASPRGTTRRRRAASRDEHASEALTGDQWQAVRASLVDLLQNAYQQADDEERQGEPSSQAAEHHDAPRTP